jgi:hypothetical protein
MTPEEKKEIARKSEVAWQFIQATPEFPQTPENSYVMLRLLEDTGLACTLENLKAAFETLKDQGKIEFPSVTNQFGVTVNVEMPQQVFPVVNGMSMEAALMQLEMEEQQKQIVAISKMSVLPLLPSGGPKQKVVWDKDFALDKLKGPVIEEPANSRPVLVENKPRRFKE